MSIALESRELYSLDVERFTDFQGIHLNLRLSESFRFVPYQIFMQVDTILISHLITKTLPDIISMKEYPYSMIRNDFKGNSFYHNNIIIGMKIQFLSGAAIFVRYSPDFIHFENPTIICVQVSLVSRYISPYPNENTNTTMPTFTESDFTRQNEIMSLLKNYLTKQLRFRSLQRLPQYQNILFLKDLVGTSRRQVFRIGEKEYETLTPIFIQTHFQDVINLFTPQEKTIIDQNKGLGGGLTEPSILLKAIYQKYIIGLDFANSRSYFYYPGLRQLPPGDQPRRIYLADEASSGGGSSSASL